MREGGCGCRRGVVSGPCVESDNNNPTSLCAGYATAVFGKILEKVARRMHLFPADKQAPVEEGWGDPRCREHFTSAG